MPSRRSIDANGFMTISDNPISRSGVFQYLGKSIGAPEPNKVYNVLRRPEVFDAECIESFKHLPFVDDHDMLGPEEQGLLPAEKKGVHGVVCDDVKYKDGKLTGTLKIFSQKLQNVIKAGKDGLSLGYTCAYKASSGVFQGKAYDYEQTDLRGNHLALVSSPRCAVNVLDHTMAYDHLDLEPDTKEEPMAEETKAFDSSEILSAIAALGASVDSRFAAMSAAMDEMKEEKKKKDDEKEEAEDEKADKSALDALEAEVAALKSRPAVDAKSLRAEIAASEELYKKVQPFVGAFDHAEMSRDEVAKYAVDKLQLTCDAGEEAAVLTGFLHNRKAPAETVSMDWSANDNADSEIDTILAARK